MKKQYKFLITIAILTIIFTFGCKIPNNNHNDDDGDDTINSEKTNRITVVGKEFNVDNKRIWINGANTPWNKWNDFGGSYDNAWWDKEFKRIKAAGINATRVWINCNNDNNAITINDQGVVSGVSNSHWSHLDQFFKTAKNNKIYIMATLLSFDHFKLSIKENEVSKPRPIGERWGKMIKSKENAASFVTNYTIPFVNKYKDNPYLWSIDICNEPDWINENEECGKLAWDNISYFLGINAAAIHENSDILVTVGMAIVKYNADGDGYEGNKVSDTYLKTLTGKDNAKLDFWAPHYYDWVGEWYGIPFYISPYGNKPNGYGLNSAKPAVIAECWTQGVKKWNTNGWNQPAVVENNILEDFKAAYKNGWQGVMPWTSNGVDGELANFKAATEYMHKTYPQLIFP